MIYKVFEIFRQSKNFFILTSNGPKRVHSSLNDSICKGYIFKDDYIKITDDTTEGIMFSYVDKKLIETDDISSDQEKTNESKDKSFEYKQESFKYNLLDYYYIKHNFIPYLTDVLPYYDKSTLRSLAKTSSSKSTGSKVLKGTIKYKTRINLANNKAYFFYIVNCGNNLIKGMIWKENFRFSCFEVGDEVEIFKYRQSKGCVNHGHIEINEFSELAYFNCDEITITDMALVTESEKNVKRDIEEKRVDEKEARITKNTNREKKNHESNLEKTQSNTKSQNTVDSKENFCNIQLDSHENIAYTVEGTINYTSMLNKKKGINYLDYYLLDVDDKKVILFYNSDLTFYELEAGNRIEISNLRKIKRSGHDLYISTIYTQFKYDVISQLKEECSSFLIEDNRNRRVSINEENSFLEDENPKRVKREASRAIEKSQEKSNLSNDNSEVENSQEKSDVSENRESENSFSLDEDNPNENTQDCIDTTFVRLNITHSLNSKNEKHTTNTKKYIEKGFGFVPDDLDSINESTELINNEQFIVHPFFVPCKISLSELEDASNKLVINESEKFILEATVLGIEEEDEFNLEYVDSDEIKRYFPVKVTVEGNINFYIFKNFFIENKLTEEIKTKVDECIGRKHLFIIHAFRDSVDNVLYCVSEMKVI